MSCCGKGRSQFQGARGPNSHPVDPRSRPFRGAAPAPRVVFEHTGSARAVVIGSVSGNRYLFDGPGSRVEVDPRDRRGMAALSELRQLT
jgi:hypothetical protein